MVEMKGRRDDPCLILVSDENTWRTGGLRPKVSVNVVSLPVEKLPAPLGGPGTEGLRTKNNLIIEVTIGLRQTPSL